jgi:hypothetical protein
MRKREREEEEDEGEDKNLWVVWISPHTLSFKNAYPWQHGPHFFIPRCALFVSDTIFDFVAQFSLWIHFEKAQQSNSL